MNITIRYGFTGTLTTDVPEGTTVGDVIRNPNYRASLGFPEAVAATIDGVTVGNHHELDSDDVVQLEKQAASKA